MYLKSKYWLVTSAPLCVCSAYCTASLQPGTFVSSRILEMVNTANPRHGHPAILVDIQQRCRCNPMADIGSSSAMCNGRVLSVTAYLVLC